MNLCEDCFNSELRIAPTIELVILNPSSYLIISNKCRKIRIGLVTTKQLANKLHMLHMHLKKMLQKVGQLQGLEKHLGANSLNS